MRYNMFSGSNSQIALGSAFFAGALLAGLCAGRANASTTITFDPQTGANEDPFVSDTESGFTVVPTTADNWFQGQSYGNPVPSIFDGPVGSPSVASIQVTAGGSDFTFLSLDESSNNGASDFTITGTEGGNTEFTETGEFSDSGNVFSTYFSTAGDSTIPIDTLSVMITPLDGTTSVNLDNIVLGEVPEPASISLLLGAAAIGFQRRRRTTR